MKKIKINNSLQSISDQETLSQILDRLEIETKGIAIASGESIIPKKQWNSYSPEEGEVFTLIRATCGG